MADSNDVAMGSKNPKCWTVLENDPEALNTLAHSLGLSRTLSFYEVPSLDEPDILGIIPRPVHALCFIIPMTPFWDECRKAEDEHLPEYQGSGPQEPVIWFKQTIGHACGSIAMLHCCLNGYGASQLEKGSTLERIGIDAEPLKMKERAQVLYDSKELEDAHKQAASMGDTVAPDNQSADKLGQHFVAFVKGKDLHLYELEGSRKGPLDRGLLGPEEDLLSKTAIDFVRASLGKTGEGDLRFSCTALAAQTEGME